MTRIRVSICSLVAAIGLYFVGNARAELIVNGGFEDGLNNWTFTGSGTNVASLSTDTPSGSGQSADLDIHNVFQLPWLIQDVPVNAGDKVTFSTWVKEVRASTPNDAWIAAQIWFLPDSGSGTILSSGAMFFTNPNWEFQQLTDIMVPAGATVARILFTPQNTSFGVGNGQYRIDDVSLTVVPEPTSLALFVACGAAFAWRRRNRRWA